MAQGTGTPKVTANVTNGNLLRRIVVTDGVAGLVGTAQSSENIGKVNTVYSITDAENKGYTEDSEPFLYRHVSEYYDELGGSQALYLLGVEDTMVMADMVDVNNKNGAVKLLTEMQGSVNIIGICRNPVDGYDAGSGFLDVDTENALVKSKALAEYQQSINRPVRFLIEGRVNDVEETIFQPITAENTFSGVVLGGSKSGGSASVGQLLGRACKYPAHIKIGSGQNGSLSNITSYIGDKKLEEFSPAEMDAFSEAGYIHQHIREGIAGYFYSVDRMAGTDDFRNFALGRLIDKAQRITTTTTMPFLESSVRITSEGTINEADAMYIEQNIKAQLLTQMSEQVSGVDVVVPTDQDLINGNTIEIEVKIQPLGYMTWIVVKLGLTKTL